MALKPLAAATSASPSELCGVGSASEHTQADGKQVVAIDANGGKFEMALS